MIALVGAFASSALALIFPPLIEILTFSRVEGKVWLGCLPRPVWIAKDIAIMTLGVVGSLFGTYAAIENIIENFNVIHAVSGHCSLGMCTDQ